LIKTSSIFAYIWNARITFEDRLVAKAIRYDNNDMFRFFKQLCNNVIFKFKFDTTNIKISSVYEVG